VAVVSLSWGGRTKKLRPEAKQLFGVENASKTPGMSQVCDDCFDILMWAMTEGLDTA
jgi:hypothetical protein